MSILAEPLRLVIDKNVEKHGNAAPSPRAISGFLYTPEGQAIAAKNHEYRPRATRRQPPSGQLPQDQAFFTIDQVFGGWTKAQATHFADGGIFDQIYQPGS